MSFQTYLRAVRKSWWLVALMIAVGLVGGFVKSALATPVYQSSITFYVSTPGTTAQSSQYADDQFAERRANSYVQLLSSERLAKLVVPKAGLHVSPGQIASEISASAELNTVLVKAVVSDTNESRALAITTALGTEFPTMVDQLDNVGLKTASVALEVVSGPTLKHTPVSPRKELNLALGLAFGLLLGLLLAVARELLDVTIRAPEVLDELFDAPTIGTIAFDPAVERAPLIVEDESRSPRAEAIRQLRTNLQFLDVDNPPRVFLVTSSVASEGKSTVAANLAIAFAELDIRVLLVEADLRRPRLSTYLGIERSVGLSSVLAGQVQLDDVLQPWGDHLSVLPSGPTPPNVASMLGSARMTELVGSWRSRFDVVIVDSPPLLPVTDAALISTMTDGVIIVARHGLVTRKQLTNSVRGLEAVGAHIFGFVFNMIPRRQAKDYTGSYDGYGYHEDPNPGSVDLARPATIAVASEQLDSAVVEPASAGPHGVGTAQTGTRTAAVTPPLSRGSALWPGGLDT